MASWRRVPSNFEVTHLGGMFFLLSEVFPHVGTVQEVEGAEEAVQVAEVPAQSRN